MLRRIMLALIATTFPAFALAAEATAGASLVGVWLGLQESVQFPRDCEGEERVRYLPDGTFNGPGMSGTWELRDGRLTEIATDVDAELVEQDVAKVGDSYVSEIVLDGQDAFVKTFSDGRHMRFLRCPAAGTS
jgi:hypothetical protein